MPLNPGAPSVTNQMPPRAITQPTPTAMATDCQNSSRRRSGTRPLKTALAWSNPRRPRVIASPGRSRTSAKTPRPSGPSQRARTIDETRASPSVTTRADSVVKMLSVRFMARLRLPLGEHDERVAESGPLLGGLEVPPRDHPGERVVEP